MRRTHDVWNLMYEPFRAGTAVTVLALASVLGCGGSKAMEAAPDSGAARSQSSDGGGQILGGSSDGSSEACRGSAPPSDAARSVSLMLTGYAFDSLDPRLTNGFNLDGKCTSATSSDVCALQPEASKVVQEDGAGGVDNSFGANVCSVIANPSGVCRSLGQPIYVITDATGSGTMAIPFPSPPPSWLEFPIHDTYVARNGASGVLGAVAPASGIVAAVRAAAGDVSPSLCAGSAFQAIAVQIEQASDILANGSDVAGSSCDSISIGVAFTGSSPYIGPLPTVDDPCGP